MRVRTSLVLPTAALIAAGVVAGLPATAAPSGGGCQLHGTATFTHGPSSTPHPFSYTFKGVLSNCHDDSGNAPASGTIATLGSAKATGDCQSDSSAGLALATWADKTRTLVAYTTQAAGAEVVLQGKVVKSARVGRTTYRTTRYAGDGAVADLAFEADPSQCAGKGVTSAGIDGFAGLGRSS
jgi:hypothetical protein